MTPAAIIKQASTEGVCLALSTTGAIKATGRADAVSRWVPMIRENKLGIVAVLKEAANEMFSFSPPGDPANDDEALQERVAIMMEGNGWDEATALREARWAADKDRCWRAFLVNAKRVLEAPAGQREGLLAQYQREASGRYGDQTGATMADGLRTWVKEGRVH